MPLYTWLDKKTERDITVHRNFSDYETPPDREETSKEWTDAEFAEADWERLISGGLPFRRGANWSGGKGYW